MPWKPQLGLERPLFTLPQGAHSPTSISAIATDGQGRNFTENKVKVRVPVRPLLESRSRDPPPNYPTARAERF